MNKKQVTANPLEETPIGVRLSNELDILFQELIEKFPKLRFYSDGRASTGFSVIRKNTFFEQEITPLLKKLRLETLVYSTNPIDYSFELGKRAALNEQTAKTIKSAKFVDVPIDGLMPLIDIRDPSKELMWDDTQGILSQVSLSSLKKAYPSLKLDYTLALLEFDPYTLEKVSYTDFEGKRVTKVNLYSPPEWHTEYKTEAEQKELKCPEIIDRFMKHLVPDERCRDFVFDWLHFALISRTETYLCLNGAKGIGKNLFSEYLAKKLIGEKYFNIAPESALTVDFNSYLSGKRLILMDEIKIDSPQKVNKLKRYINADQNIEKKGIDADKTVRTFNSFIISNNDATDLAIQWDDRRFSAIDLTKVKLEDVWTKKDIAELTKLSDETIKDFGYWIFYRKPKVMEDEFTVWRGNHFYDLCYNTLPEWCKVIHDLIVQDGYTEVEMDDVKREYRRRSENSRMPRAQKVRDFLENYRLRGEDSLGTFVDSPEGFWKIDINPIFIRESIPDESVL